MFYLFDVTLKGKCITEEKIIHPAQTAASDAMFITIMACPGPSRVLEVFWR